MFHRMLKLDERMRSFDIVIFLTGLSDGISGGDVHALRFAEYVASEELSKVVVVAPRYVVNLLPPKMNQVIDERYRLCDLKGYGLLPYVVVSAKRVISTAIHSPNARIALSSSHFLNDVLASIFHKLRYRSECVMYVHHIVRLKQRRRSLRSWASVSLEYLSLRLALVFKFMVLVGEVEAEEELLRMGFTRDRMTSTTNSGEPWGIDSVEFSPPSGRIAVWLGRVAIEKGVLDLVPIAQRLESKVPDVTIHVLGVGPAYEILRDLIKREHVCNIKVWGFVPEDQKWSILRSASLMLAPSTEEGWGIAVDEAVSVGLPIIAYDLLAYGRLSGRIAVVPVGDVEAFAEMAGELLATPSALATYRELLRDYCGSSWSSIVQAEFDWLESKTSDWRDSCG